MPYGAWGQAIGKRKHGHSGATGVAQFWEQSKPGGLTLFSDTHLTDVGAHGSWSGMDPLVQFIPNAGWSRWSEAFPAVFTVEGDAPFPGDVFSIRIPAGVYNGTGVGSLRSGGCLGTDNWTEPGWKRKYECVMMNPRSVEGGGTKFTFGDAGGHKWSYVGTHTGSTHLGSINIQFDYSALGQSAKNGGTSGMVIARQSEGPLGTFYASGHVGVTEDSLIHTEQWNCIEHYTQVSDPGEANGICWVKRNGVIMAEAYDIDFSNVNPGQQYLDGTMYETVINGTFPVPEQEIAINRISCYYGT